MRRKIENLKPNTPVELTFLDHCSHDGGWIRLAFIKHLKLSEIKLIGYYVHSNKDSHFFAMGYCPREGDYGPLFQILKTAVTRWRKV